MTSQRQKVLRAQALQRESLDNSAQSLEAQPSAQEVEALLQLMNNFGRVKLSLNTLMLRPKWHDQLFELLRLQGLDDPELQSAEHIHWLPPFYRLGRIFSLNGQKSLNMRSIATHFGIPLSSATRIIDQLVQRGLVERLPDAQDRRVVLVTLSPRGEQVLQILEQSIYQRTTELLSHFSPQDRQQMLSLGQRLYEFWTASLEESTPTAPQGEV